MRRIKIKWFTLDKRSNTAYVKQSQTRLVDYAGDGIRRPAGVLGIFSGAPMGSLMELGDTVRNHEKYK